jgi:hypothetical protein
MERADEEAVHCKQVKGCKEGLEWEAFNTLTDGSGGSPEWVERGLSVAVVGAAMEGMGMADVISKGNKMHIVEECYARCFAVD